MAESTLAQIRKLRIEKVKKLRKMGIDPYPSKGQRTNTNQEILDDYKKFEGTEATLVGRLMSWREHGHLIFGHIQDRTGKIQLYIKDDQVQKTSKKDQNLGFKDLELLDIGDFVQITGKITKTKRGETSISPKLIKLLTKYS